MSSLTLTLDSALRSLEILLQHVSVTHSFSFSPIRRFHNIVDVTQLGFYFIWAQRIEPARDLVRTGRKTKTLSPALNSLRLAFLSYQVFILVCEFLRLSCAILQASCNLSLNSDT